MPKDPKWYHLDKRALSNLIVICVGILLYQGLTHLDQVRAAFNNFMTVLTPFIAGFILAYLLNTPVTFFRKKIYHECRFAGMLSIVSVYLLALALIAFLIQLVLPQVADSVFNLVNNLSVYLENLNVMAQGIIARFHLTELDLSGFVADYQSIVKQALNFITSSVPELLNLGMAVGSGVVTALTALIASIYMLAGKDRLLAQMRKLIYALFPAKSASHVLEVAARANGIFVGFINGKLLDSAIMGLLCFVLTTLFRIPYAVLVSVVVGLTNIIPFFGPIIGAVPCLMILLIVDPWSALRFGVLVVALQQFDGNILGPKILGNSTGLSAIWVLVSIVLGGGLFGFPGMVLGVPTFAVLYSLVRDWSDERLAEKGIDASGNPVAADKLQK